MTHLSSIRIIPAAFLVRAAVAPNWQPQTVLFSQLYSRLGSMAKRSFSPVLWFLLALMLRADVHVAGQTRYPAASRNKTSLSTIPPSNWKSPKPAPVARTSASQSPLSASQTVDYEISGETYENDSYAEVPPARNRVSRRLAKASARPSRVR